ncbi:MAG: hypothetical protein ABW215_16440 [Kibdelosporangium sp.]
MARTRYTYELDPASRTYAEVGVHTDVARVTTVAPMEIDLSKLG